MLPRFLMFAVFGLLAQQSWAQDDSNQPSAPPQAQSQEREVEEADARELVPVPELDPAPDTAEAGDIRQIILSTTLIDGATDFMPADQLPEKAAYVATAIPDMVPALKILGYAIEETSKGMTLHAAVASLNGKAEVLLCFKHNGNCDSFNTTGQVTELLANVDLIDFDGFRHVLLCLAQTQEKHLRKLEDSEELTFSRYGETRNVRRNAAYEVVLQKSAANETVSFRQ